MVFGFLAGLAVRTVARRVLPAVAKRAAPLVAKAGRTVAKRVVQGVRSRLRGAAGKPVTRAPKPKPVTRPSAGRPIQTRLPTKPVKPVKATPRRVKIPSWKLPVRATMKAGRTVARVAPTAAAVGITAVTVKDLMTKKPAPQPQPQLPPAVTFPKPPGKTDMEPGEETSTPPATPPSPPPSQPPQAPSPPAGEELTGMPGLQGLLQQWGAKVPKWLPLVAGAGALGITAVKGFGGGQMVDLEGLLPDIGVAGPGIFRSGIAPEGAQVVAAWTANGIPFVRLADGRICAQKKDGTVKCWRPYRPMVFGKKVDARKFARLAKKYRKTYQELHKLFGRRTRRCR